MWRFYRGLWYYVEKRDLYEYFRGCFLERIGDRINIHILLKKYKDPYFYWEAMVDPHNKTIYEEVHAYPYWPNDHQALIEITNPNMYTIVTSHFYNIMYFDNTTWRYWWNHVKIEDKPPFYVIEVSHHEFYAVTL